jgi:hypothetical protein
MANEDSWTKVGKGGKPVSFPPDAASAFGNRKKTIYKSSEFPTMATEAFGRKDRRTLHPIRAEFDAPAAAAFGSKQKRNLRSENVEFDASAASVFGSKAPRNTRKEFDDAAAAAFGSSSRREEFPSAFGGKKHSGFAEAAQMGFDDADGVEWKHSAFGKKRAMATSEPKKQTYEEMFPSLGPVTATPTIVKAPTKESFADLVRARAAQDEAEAAAKAERDRFEEKERRRAEYERSLLRRINQNRPFAGVTTASYDDSYEMDETMENVISKDLDCDVYGAVRSEAVLIENTESSSSSDDDDDDNDIHEEDDAYWTRK